MTRTGDEKPIGAVGQRERRPKSRAARAAQDVITGDFMGDSRLRRWYPLALYCILLVFLSHRPRIQFPAASAPRDTATHGAQQRTLAVDGLLLHADERLPSQPYRGGDRTARTETRRVHGTAQNSPVSTGKKTGIAAGTQATHSTRPKRQRRRARQTSRTNKGNNPANPHQQNIKRSIMSRVRVLYAVFAVIAVAIFAMILVNAVRPLRHSPAQPFRPEVLQDHRSTRLARQHLLARRPHPRHRLPLL